MLLISLRLRKVSDTKRRFETSWINVMFDFYASVILFLSSYSTRVLDKIKIMLGIGGPQHLICMRLSLEIKTSSSLDWPKIGSSQRLIL